MQNSSPNNPQETAQYPAPHLHQSTRHGAVAFLPAWAILIGLIDILILAAWATGNMGPIGAFLTHVLAVFVIFAFSQRRSADPTNDLLRISLLAMMGPLGGAFLQTLALVNRHLITPAPRIADDLLPQDRPSAALYADIAQNRRQNRDRGAPQTLAALFAGDTPQRHRAALTRIANHYSPAMRPALQQALQSENPALRVQAAAVFAKLRGDASQRAGALLLQSEPFSEAQCKTAHRLCASGFLADKPLGELRARCAEAGFGPSANGPLDKDELGQADLDRGAFAQTDLDRDSGSSDRKPPDPARADLDQRDLNREAAQTQTRHRTTPLSDPSAPPIRRYSCGGMA